MKKTIIMTGLLLLLGSTLFALENFGIRLVTESSVNIQGIDFNDKDGETNGREISFDGLSPVYWGLTGDFVFNKVGVGFNTQAAMYEDDNKDFITAWDVNLFLSYHFFGTDQLFDLFTEAGVGCAGMVNVDSRQDDDFITMKESRESDNENMDFMELALFPHVGVGLAFNPGRGFLTLGAKMTVRPVAGPVPYAPIEFHDVSMFEASLFAGVVFNSSRRKARHEAEEDEEEWEDRDEDLEEAREEYEEALAALEEEMDETGEDDDFIFEFGEIKTEDTEKENNINIDVKDGDRDVNINITVE